MLIDPRDSNRVYVAALGRLYTEGGERGVFRTTDGGATWTKILAPGHGFEAAGREAAGPMTGFIDLVLDPSNPDVLYAAAWDRSRRPWDFVEGGTGSALYKSTDGGDSWTLLGGGFPHGALIGRIGLTLAASDPSILYASVDNQEELPEEMWDLGDTPVNPKRLRKMSKEEFLAQDPEAIEDFIRSNDLDTSLDAKKLIEMVKNDEVTLEALLEEISDANANLFNTDIRGLEVYRSSDGGAGWARTHDEPLRDITYTYGYYFGQIRVAPDNPERLYIVGVPILESLDGGKSWHGVNGRDVHVDHHGLWIDPEHSQHVLLGNDGGVDVSYDGGKSWLGLDAEPVGQFYTVEVDMAEPYNIYGGLQDNGVLKGSSRSRPALDAWRFIGGGDGMDVEVDPRDNATTYWGFQFGFYFRNEAAGGREMIRPRDKLGDPALRYNWLTPIHLSEHNADVLYFGANRVYRSLDQGDTWTAISDDLTLSKMRGDVPFATVATLAESALQFGLLWAGTDDGQVWLTVDGGTSWRDMSAGLPADRWVSRVAPSRHVRERVYVTLNGYRDDDIAAYVYRSDDLGATWTSIAADLPAEAVNVIHEDPVNADVLYVGTDRGVYVSLDRGAAWQALQGGDFPNVPVHDLVVHPRDRELVAGTHGRSVWVVDVLPVQELAKVREEAVHVFPLEEVQYQRFWQGSRSAWFHDPEDDPKVEIPIWSKAGGSATLTILDADGRELRRVEAEVEEGVSTLTWDLLLDQELALAAETAQLAAAVKSADAEKKNKKKSKEVDTPKTPEEGTLAKTPWAEAVRLGWPLYATPATYTLRVGMNEESAETELVVKPPRPREPRMAPPMKIRGQKDEKGKTP